MKLPGTLRVQLILLLGLSLLPSSLLVSYNAWEARTAARTAAYTAAEQLVNSAVDEQKRLVGAARQLLSALSELPDVQADTRTCAESLAKLLKLYPRYLNLGVISLDGRVPCSALPLGESVNLRDRSYFQRALTNQDFSIGDYQVGRITGMPSVNFGYPVSNGHGDVQSVVYGALDLSWLEQLLARQDLPAGASIRLYDTRGTVLAAYPPSPDATPSGEDTWLSYSASLLPSYNEAARVEVRIPENTIYSDINQRFLRDLSLLGVVALLAFSLAWLGSERAILQRVTALVSAARRIGDGQLDARTGLPPGKDEIAQVASSFDQMAEALETREQALVDALAEVHHINRALRTLSGGNRALLHAEDVDWLAQKVCRVIVETGEYPAALIAFRGQGSAAPLQVIANAGEFHDNEAALEKRLKKALEADTHQILLGEDADGILALPLISSDAGNLGVLAIQKPISRDFDAMEIELLAETADDLTFGIQTLRTRERERLAQQKIHQMEWYEPLTDLPNRNYLQRELQHLISVHENGQSALTLLLLDLDRFRDINTGLGYTQGDQVLQSMAPRLAPHLPANALVAHLGEDEFAVLLPTCDIETASGIARDILTALEQPMLVEDLPLDISASLGIAAYPEHGHDPDTLLRAADAAMYRAKKMRRGLAVYTPYWDQVTPQRLSMAGELRHAIEKEQLVLYFQPKLDLKDRTVRGAEALLRWQHPERGQIPPGDFIPLAEETGLIAPLTDWVLEAAARQSHLWQEKSLVMPLAVNLSARNLHEPNLISRIESLLADWDIEGERFGLELTESALMQSPEQALDTIKQLHHMGVTLYIDDFGTGYSSLSYLQKLPIDVIKIDKSFVLDMDENAGSHQIVESTIALAHKLGKRVVAEGVENEEILEMLANLGCDAVQGFYISRPVPADEFIHWLKSNNH